MLHIVIIAIEQVLQIAAIKLHVTLIHIVLATENTQDTIRKQRSELCYRIEQQIEYIDYRSKEFVVEIGLTSKHRLRNILTDKDNNDRRDDGLQHK